MLRPPGGSGDENDPTFPIFSYKTWRTVYNKKKTLARLLNLRAGSMFFTYQEGLNRVNRQPSNGLKCNRLPSKKVLFYRQLPKMQSNINRQNVSRGISNLTISADLHGLLAPEASFNWRKH